LISNEVKADVFIPKHNLPCGYVSKTHKYENMIFDYRQYYNNKLYKNVA